MPHFSRIALVSLYPADPTRISGGTRMAAYLIVEGLRRRQELDIHVVHCHSDILSDSIKKEGNVQLHYLALPRKRLIPNMVSGIGRVAKLLEEIRPDVVHCHSFHYAVAALRAGHNPVWTIHGSFDWEAHYASGFQKKLFFYLARILAGYYERLALDRVREITAINPWIQDLYRKKTEARWHLIENPVADDLFRLTRGPVKGRLLLPASVIPIKDPITAVKALALAREKLPFLHLQIAGRMNETGYVKKVQDACRKFRVPDSVQFLGLQTQAQMRHLYREAQLVVLSSRKEVSPLAAIEGLAAGVPVVTTRAGGAGYIIEDNRTGRTVDPGDADGLANAICEVLGDEAGYRRLSENARAEAEKRFRKDLIAERYLAVYNLARKNSLGTKNG